MKCKYCGASIIDDDLEGAKTSVCDKCRTNTERQYFLKKVKAIPYFACPFEGEALEILEYGADGTAVKFRCPKCHRILTEPMLKKFSPSFASYAYFCDDQEEKSGFKPAAVANFIKDKFLFKTNRRTDILYRYDNERGIWADDGETYLAELVALMLGEENRQIHFRNILHHLKSLTYQEVTFKTKFLATPDGLLDVETGARKEFTPNEMTRFAIPTSYDPDAKCPNWEQFVSQVVAPEDVALLQEWTGYILLPDYRFHKVLWVHGHGRNGKGVWTRTVEGLIGRENCSGVGLEELDGNHRFALAQLNGKLFNSCSEPPTSRILQTTLLKRATGQDTIIAELKGKNERLGFTNCGKFTIIGNRFPRVNDVTLAFTDRIMFIRFPNVFVGDDQIQNLERVWLKNPEEMSAILNWALTGLHRLLSQGYFTESKTQQETAIEFKRVSDSIGAFLDEMGIFDVKLAISRSYAYDKYKGYCEDLGVQPESDRMFTQRMKQTPNVRDAKSHGERLWKGVAFKEMGADGANGADVTYYDNLRKATEIKEYIECAPTAPSAPELLAKDCANFHRASCEHPNPTCLLPTFPCPARCRGFKQDNGQTTAEDSHV